MSIRGRHVATAVGIFVVPRGRSTERSQRSTPLRTSLSAERHGGPALRVELQGASTPDATSTRHALPKRTMMSLATAPGAPPDRAAAEATPNRARGTSLDARAPKPQRGRPRERRGSAVPGTNPATAAASPSPNSDRRACFHPNSRITQTARLAQPSPVVAPKSISVRLLDSRGDTNIPERKLFSELSAVVGSLGGALHEPTPVTSEELLAFVHLHARADQRGGRVAPLADCRPPPVKV
jgi:hypothetical protein